MTFCREKFKKFIFLEMMMFVIKNPDKYQPNVAIHGEGMRQRNQFHLQISKNIFSPKRYLLFLNEDM